MPSLSRALSCCRTKNTRGACVSLISSGRSCCAPPLAAARADGLALDVEGVVNGRRGLKGSLNAASCAPFVGSADANSRPGRRTCPHAARIGLVLEAPTIMQHRRDEASTHGCLCLLPFPIRSTSITSNLCTLPSAGSRRRTLDRRSRPKTRTLPLRPPGSKASARHRAGLRSAGPSKSLAESV